MMGNYLPLQIGRNFNGYNLIFLVGLIIYLQLTREKIEGGQEHAIILKGGVLVGLGSKVLDWCDSSR